MARIRSTTSRVRAAAAVLGAVSINVAQAGGGPLGIDHKIGYDDSGIWNRRYQLALQDGLPASILALALWQGDGDRLGHTAWQSVDSMLVGAVASTGLKAVFSRSRPNETDNPNQFFQGWGHTSFPSGEVTLVTAAVTPFVLEYGSEHPAVWALELLPLYDATARLKSQAHWQTDVLAGFAIGTAVGYYAHSRTSSFTVGVLPHGWTIGWKHSF